MRNAERFIAARDLLSRYREDLAAARAAFHWPRFEEFNWARDYFDVIAADNHNPALRVVSLAGAEETVSFAQLSQRSAQVANFLSGQGVGPGDRMLLMLGNGVPLWETLLAAIKLGVVIIPTTTLLERTELQDRLQRGRVKVVVTAASLTDRFEGLALAPVRIAVGEGRGPLRGDHVLRASHGLATADPTGPGELAHADPGGV